MISKLPQPAVKPSTYEKEAKAYLESLPLEHFMESTAQATQREITLESLALLKAQRQDVHVFNELLVMYPLADQKKLEKVVPDNMVVLTQETLHPGWSFNIPLEPAAPFWVFEYLSRSNKRKDYVDSRRKYERVLKVPYYLLFDHDEQELVLYHHNQRRYVKVKPNDSGRFLIQELDIEVGLLDGWVRYWYKGKLLPLPADLQRQFDLAQRQAEDARRHAEKATLEKEQATRQAEESARRAEDLQRRLEAAEQELARVRTQQ